MFIVTFIGVIAAEIWIRRNVRGGTLFVFFDQSRNQTHRLVKLGTRATVTLRIGGSEETYTVNADRRYLVQYPFGFPAWLQETVPAYYYVYNKVEPIDPVGASKHDELASARMLTQLTDETMLSAMVREAREAAEGQLVPNRNLPIYILVGVGINAVLGIAILFMGFLIKTEVSKILEAIQ